MNRWFFLSHANDNKDRYLRKFYQDLNRQVSARSGERGDGFLDETSIELGKRWSDELTGALQDCRTFIPIYSPSYFTSDFCGKEWQIFNNRQDAYTAKLEADKSRPSLVFPVLWIPASLLPKALPEAVSKVQYQHSDLGEVYAREGLWQLMKVGKYRDQYNTFLAKLAEKVIQAAREHVLPPDPHPRPADEIESAFHPRANETVRNASKSTNAGPRCVQVVFVAGRKDELSEIRQKVESYGEKGGRDWFPYLPDVTEEIGIMVQRIATAEQFHYEYVHIDDGIIKRIEDAERQNNIVAIIVDTWTLCLPRYSLSMREYDGRKFLNCVVLVSWNKRDPETTTMLSSLINGMQRTFLRNCIQRDTNCFFEISSHEELKRALSAALHKALQRIIQGSKVMRAESEPFISKPLITGVRS